MTEWNYESFISEELQMLMPVTNEEWENFFVHSHGEQMNEWVTWQEIYLDDEAVSYVENNLSFDDLSQLYESQFPLKKVLND